MNKIVVEENEEASIEAENRLNEEQAVIGDVKGAMMTMDTT